MPKKRSSHLICKLTKFLPAMLLASLLGTYLDLFFVGKGLYVFPKRLFPDVFTINIVFTLFALPLFIALFLYISKKINSWARAALILVLSFIMSIIEKQSETFGFFIHHKSWEHIYSFYGYILFLIIIYSFHHWQNKQ